MEPEGLVPFSQKPSTGPRSEPDPVHVRDSVRHFVTICFFWRVVNPTPNPQAGGSLLDGCPRLLIQYIRSCPPYLEAVSSIRNLRTGHAVVTRDPLNIQVQVLVCLATGA
jgi:hypothetical protein